MVQVYKVKQIYKFMDDVVKKYLFKQRNYIYDDTNKKTKTLQ